MGLKPVFLSYAFPPLAFPRSVQVARLVKHLDSGRPEVWCAEDSSATDSSMLAVLGDSQPSVDRLAWTGRARLARGLRRVALRDRLLVPDPYRPWAAAARRALAQRGFDRGEVLVTFGQPMSDHVAGAALKRRTGVPWVAHFSDPWAASSYRGGGRLTRAANRRLERSTIEAADRLVFTTQETVDLVMDGYEPGLREKTRVIPHAFDEELFPDQDSRSPGRPIVRYLGNFYGHRTPEPLFKGLGRLAAEQPSLLHDVKVELIGAAEEDLTRSAAYRKLPAGLVDVLPPVGYLASLGLMRAADLLVVVDAPDTRSVFLPSKLIEYVGARRPIVAITPPGPAATLTRELGGWPADPRDPEEVAQALARGFQVAREQGARPWGVEQVRSRYAAPRVARAMEDAIKPLA